MRLLRTTGLRTAGPCLLATAAALAAGGCTFLTGVRGVSRVTVTIAPREIAVNQTAAAFGTAFDGNDALQGTRYNVTFTSRDPSVATVNAITGQVIGVKFGSTYIIGENRGKRDSALITVRPVPARQVVIGPRTPFFRVGATNALSASILDSVGNQLRDRTVAWTPRTPAVLSITNLGVVTPLAVGTTWVVASVDNGLNTPATVDSVLATVTPVPIIDIRITPTSPTLYTGQTLLFTATVTDSLQAQVTRRVVWSTSDRGTVLAIDSLSGLARAISPSSFNTTVTAVVDVVPGFTSAGTRTAAVSASVLAPTNSVRIANSGGATITTLSVAAAASAAITLVPLDAVGNALGGRTFRLTSSDPAVATVPATSNSSTQVTAVSAGTTTITVQALDVSGAPQGNPATLAVTVQP